MKKILFAAFAALSMIACNKDDATTVIPDIDNTLNGAIVAMRFTDETQTRAFFAEAAAAEAWEKSLSSLSVYVFNAKDRKSTRLNSSHGYRSRMPSSA